MYSDLENKDELYTGGNKSYIRLPVYNKAFVKQKKSTYHSTLYSIKAPFELLHSDIADIRFFSKSAIDPKYCLLIVDLFTSKIYAYHMKSKNLLLRKLNNFYNDISEKRDAS